MHTILLLVLTAAVALSNAAKIPKGWQVCKKNDPKLNECMRDAIQSSIPDLMKGIPSLGVLPLDPLHLIRLELDQGSSSGPVAVNLTFMDIDFHGFKSAKMMSAEADWDKGYLKGTISLSEPITLLGNYAINGKVLVLPITGSGKCNFTLTDVSIDLIGKLSTATKNGKKYYHTDTMELVIRESKVYMELENLFNGDKALGENMNKFLNENWKEVFEAFEGTLTKGLASAFREIANRVFDKIPADQISPL